MKLVLKYITEILNLKKRQCNYILYTLHFCKKKSLAKLQNASLLIICHGRLFVIEFPDEIKYTKFQPLAI